MRGLYHGACFLLAAACASPADIQLPQPPVVPTPLPDPGAVLTLAADQLYVAQSDAEFVVRDHPKGLVKVTSEKGPIRIRGKFAGGTATETKTFDGPYVAYVEAAGKGRVELDFIPTGFKSEKDIRTAVLDVDGGPVTPPKPPDPPKPPEPKPPEPPVPAKTFQVVIVYESGVIYTATQNSVLYGKAVEDYLTGRCTGGKAGWGRRDQNTDPASDTSGLRALWAAVKPSVTSTPALAIAVNDKVTLEPLPATPADAIVLLKKYAGDK